MARYMKAIDVWAYGEEIRSGQIKLQTGQWIKLGNDNNKLSRFHHANKGHICAFHFPRHVSGFNAYVGGIKEEAARLKAIKQAKL